LWLVTSLEARCAARTEAPARWIVEKRLAAAWEQEAARSKVDAVEGALTHTKADTTLRYIRRRSTKMAEVAAARSSKRAADKGDGTT
jgi:hypothetical protein